MTSPQTFVSYSWDTSEGPGHSKWVRRLCEHLVDRGIKVRLDQWHVAPGESFTHFMEQEVRNSDFIIAICTPAFAAKSSTRSGGVGYEQQIVSGHIVSGTPRSKFIPIIRKGNVSGDIERAIPDHFLGTRAIDFRDDAKFEEALDELVRAIHKAPRYQPPPLGPVPNFELSDTVGETEPSILPFGVFEFGQDFLPVGGEEALKLSTGEVLENLKVGLTPPARVVITGYRSMIEEKNKLDRKSVLSVEERQRRLTLLRDLEILCRDSADPERKIEEIIINSIKAACLFGITGAASCSEIILQTVKEWRGGFSDKTGRTKFDVIDLNSVAHVLVLGS